MSASPETSPFDQNLSELSDNEHSTPSVPRIKLKIRLNPIPSPSDFDQDENTTRKHKRKKKRSHKKHKHKHSEGENQQHDKYAEYQHMPVGGKRPFAMLQQQQSYTQGDDNMDEDEVDELDTYHPTDVTTAAKKSKSNRTSSKPASTKSSKTAKSKTKSKTGKRSTKDTKTVKPSKKRGRPTKKAQARAASLSSNAPALSTQQQHHYHGTQTGSKDHKKDLKSTCLKLWETLSKRDAYGFFLEPVNTKIVRDYLSVIKRPMDFSTLRQKIENDKYKTMDDFRKDFLLIVQNAKLYNAPDTIYWKSADKLENYGVKAIERAEKLIHEPSTTPHQASGSFSTYLGNRQYSWQQEQKAVASRKESTAIKEEEVDILGLDGPARKASRVDSERTTREPSLDTQSRAATPLRQQQQQQAKKKKKKKMTDSGVIYGPDGSIHAIGGVYDLRSLVPSKHAFSDPPYLTTVNPQALPSAFYQPNRSIHDDWASHKHFIQPAVFCDYGPFPFTTLGNSTPAMFYRPQDAQYVYPLYGDDGGEAYLKSVWQFMGDLGLDDKATLISRHITLGGWDVMTSVINNMDKVMMDDDIDVDGNHDDESILVTTEFGDVDVGSLLKELKQNDDKNNQTSHIKASSESATTTPMNSSTTLTSSTVPQETTPQPTTTMSTSSTQ
ncbi:uncharacterized protein BX664DRAFT_278497 [Halteromyces radiatus]|uniref:uncharacterized protein n=1 Tax=Halteromyces radiatus TaxID=101107 RepID=UPI00221F7EE2|nr:uncharacterized protein BX664DRAFT_278497 [Halteromyces radiatus]KAI8093489.1 hypothetical protein BX664DRAFT_278497 [Halteromyces radiatus]